MTRDKQNIGLIAYSTVLLVLAIVTQLTAAVGELPSSTTVTPPKATTLSTSTSRYGNPLVEHKHERNCKALCEHCGCLGFYCGEECICECNNENSDTECIHTMQVNARTLNSPFEILIQGPSSNRFVRNAQQFEQKRELVTRSAVPSKTTRNRRSTITIYKPSFSGIKSTALSLNGLETASPKHEKLDLGRHKRSVDHLEWFNDFASGLVRPSPLGKQREAKAAYFKRQAATPEPLPRANREPWFLEHSAPLLNRPAPLPRRQQQLKEENERARKNKKQNSRRTVSIEDEDEDDNEPEVKKSQKEIRPLRDALQVVERIPRVLQDTVNHLAADNNSGDVFSLNIMNDVRPKKIERKEKARTTQRRRERTRDNDVDTLPSRPTRAPIAMPAAPLSPRGLLLPWLRQRRLRRFGMLAE